MCGRRESVGSTFIDNHTRQTLKVPDHSLNYAMLRGLDRAVETDYPGSSAFCAVKGVPEIQGSIAAGTVKRHHEACVPGVPGANPARKDWDQIIVVVPEMADERAPGHWWQADRHRCLYCNRSAKRWTRAEILSTTWWKILPASRCVPGRLTPHFYIVRGRRWMRRRSRCSGARIALRLELSTKESTALDVAARSHLNNWHIAHAAFC